MSNANLKSRLSGKAQSKNTTPTEMPVPKKTPTPKETSAPKEVPTTELSMVDSGYVALATNAIGIISENLKNQPLSYQLFDVVKAPTGGITMFSVPGLSGDDIQKELTGIILNYTTPRAYWETSEPIEGTPPVCYSRDSFTSFEGKSCITCPYNEFGSKNGDSNAKACKESVEAYLLRPDNIMPIIVRIPVTSKFIFQKYMTRLVSNMIPLCGVVTKITLEKVTSTGGQPYAKYNFEAVDTLSHEETANARSYGQKFAEMVNVAYETEVKAAVVAETAEA